MRVSRIGTYASLVLASLVMVVPLLVILMASLKSDDEFRAEGPLDPPRNWLNPANFVTALTDGNMIGAFVNTTIILGFSCTGTILIGSMAAYALDRFRFRLRGLVVLLFLVATLVPSVTTQVATFQVVNSLGLFNTRAAASCCTWAPTSCRSTSSCSSCVRYRASS